ncbi:MAG TPA: phosphoglycerate dehydrogenase, partial [Pseudonocardiaceae bacterium]
MELTVLFPADHREFATASITGHHLVPYDPARPAEADGGERAQVLVAPFLTDSALVEHAATLPRLRLVQLLTVGADAWLGRVPDGVHLATGRGAHSAATAEWVLGAMLAVYREFPAFLAAAAEGQWRPRRTDGLFGRRVLVVGAGD